MCDSLLQVTAADAPKWLFHIKLCFLKGVGVAVVMHIQQLHTYVQFFSSQKRIFYHRKYHGSRHVHEDFPTLFFPVSIFTFTFGVKKLGKVLCIHLVTERLKYFISYSEYLS